MWHSQPALIWVMALGAVFILGGPGPAATFQTPAAGPLRVHPDNPRYFTDDSGRAIYLTGSHVWQSLQDQGTTDPPPAYDFNAYLNFLQQQNHNFIRLWAGALAKYNSGGTLGYASPFPWPRTGPGTALDGKPKFNLHQLNQAYFDRLYSRVITARDRGIYVSIMLFEGHPLVHSLAPWRWDGHPMNSNNNINGINGDPNGDGYGIETQSQPLPVGVETIQKAYVRKVIDTVNDLDNVLFEISNETGGYSTAWQYDLINYIHTYEAGKPKQHPVGMTFQWSSLGAGTNANLFHSSAEWISPGNHGPDDYLNNPPAATGSKVILADSDHIDPGGCDGVWVWKSFLRGLNPIFMDGGIETFPPLTDARRVSARHAMGYTCAYAHKMDLAAMTPRGDLASTTYCLANLGVEYLIYLPSPGIIRGRGIRALRWLSPVSGNRMFRWLSQRIGWNVTATVDLSAAAGTLHVEWFNPTTGQTIPAGTTAGGTSRDFTAPFVGDAVLYLKKAGVGPTP